MDGPRRIECFGVKEVDEHIIETYACADGSAVHIADDAYRDKTPEQLANALETVRAAVLACLSSAGGENEKET